MLCVKPEAMSSNLNYESFIFILFFRFFKLAITLFRENSGTKSLHKRLHISLEKLGISMNRACPRVLTFLIVYLVKSVDNFHRGMPHCAVVPISFLARPNERSVVPKYVFMYI